MILSFVFLFALFAFTGFLGYRWNKLVLWNWVDVVYYPLAALSILFIFITSDSSRKLLELNQLILQKKSQIAEIRIDKLNYNNEDKSQNQLMNANFALIKSIADLGVVCTNLIEKDTTCEVAAAISVEINELVKVIDSKSDEQAANLPKVCQAAETFLKNVAESNLLPVVGGDLYSEFHNILKKNYGLYDHSLLDEQIKLFEVASINQITNLQKSVLKGNSQAEIDVLAQMHESLRLSKGILSGLRFCLLAPQEMMRASQLTKTYDQKQAEVSKLTQEVEREIKIPFKYPTLEWLKLNFWPLLLLLALSLKFAKGVSGLRGR